MSHDVAYYLENPDEVPNDPALLEQLAANGTIEIKAGEDGDDKKGSDAGNPADEAAQGDKGKASDAGQGKGNGEVEDGAAGVLGRDGKTVIPYGVLKGAREEAATLRTENEDMRRRIAELEAKGAVTTAQEPTADQEDRIKAEFTSTYGMTYDEFKDEFGDDQARIMEAQVKQNVVLKDELAALKANRGGDPELTEQEKAALTVQDAIDANTTLSDWQQNNKAMWAAAKAADRAYLDTDPKYAAMDLRERFNTLIERMGVKQPVNNKPTVDEKAEEALRKAAENSGVPTSLSSFPAGGAPGDQTELAAIERMSVIDLERAMSDPKRAAEILANL